VLWGLTLAVLCWAYAPSLGGPFTLDDTHLLVSDKVREPGAWKDRFWDLRGRPLVFATLRTNFVWFGEHPWGYHATNLFLHLANVLLAAKLAGALGLGPGARWAGASLFGFLPLASSGVCYLSARSDLLATLFVQGSLITLWKGLQASHGIARAALFASSAACFLAGLGSKEIASVSPLLVLLLSAVTRRRITKGIILPVMAAILLSISLYGRAMQNAWKTGPAASYALEQGRALPRYGRLLLFPYGLHLDHDLARPEGDLPPEGWAALTLLGVGLLAAAALRSSHAAPACGVGMLWLLTALTPTSSIIPIEDPFFEHRMYLPLIGAGLFSAGIAGCLPARKSAPALAAVLALFCSQLRSRCESWRTERQLWSDNLRWSPTVRRAHRHLSFAHERRDDPPRTERSLRHAIQSTLAREETWLSTMHAELGRNLARQRKPAEGILALLRAQQQTSSSQERAANLFEIGRIYLEEGAHPTHPAAERNDLYRSAAEAFLTAARTDPPHLQAMNAAAVALAHAGDHAEAERLLKSVLEMHPDHPEALLNLANLCASMKRWDEAEALLRRCLELDPNDPAARANLKRLLKSKGGRDHNSRFRP
jgi:hypothetical protein